MYSMLRAPHGRRARLHARTLVAALTFANAAAAFAQSAPLTLDAALQSAA
ncbi:TolC family protein, partial [Burkholderia pseudomallei]